MTVGRVGCALLAVLTLVVVLQAFAQDARKGEVLVAAGRQALGGESRLAGVKSLHVAGTFRRVIGTDDTEGDFEVFLELPDKYLRSEKTGIPGQPSRETIEALVGTEVRDVVRGGGGGRGGRGGGGGDNDGNDDAAALDDQRPDSDDRDDPSGNDRDAGGAADAPVAGRGRGPAGLAADSEAQRRGRQADVARLMTMWLMAANVPMTWIGIAESPDGKADVLEARFADGQPTRVFLDITSHMPLMMQWQGTPARAGGPGGRRGGRGERGGGGGAAVDSAGTGQVSPNPIRFDMTFSDHRVVNGIKLPFVVTRGINGKTVERWAIRSYRVNPSFSADTFTR
jgi:hypothetical protein